MVRLGDESLGVMGGVLFGSLTREKKEGKSMSLRVEWLEKF